MEHKKPYTCAEYREEMMLLGLKQRLNHKNLSEEEKEAISREIKKLEIAMGIH